MNKREFTVAGKYHYDRSSPVRWIVSHLLRYKHLIILDEATASVDPLTEISKLCL